MSKVPRLFSKDENLLKSAPIIGGEILKILVKSEGQKISIFDVVKKLKKANKFSVRNIYYGMIFLYSLDIIEFNEPYLVLKC